MDTKDEIMATLQRHHAGLQALGVARLGLFGSFVRNQQTDDSDVEVIVEFREGRKSGSSQDSVH